MAATVALACAGVAAHEHSRIRRLLLPLWIETQRDISYGPDPQNRLDVLRPRWKARGQSPGVLVFHGGGWTRGSREDMYDRVCRRYVEMGFVAVNADYRLGAIGPAVEDASRALEWVWDAAPALGIDGTRLIVTGESAGSYLALLAAFQSKRRVAAVVNFYGPTDLTSLWSRPAIRPLLSSDQATDMASRLSPLAFLRPDLPPVLSIHGTADQTIPPEQPAALTHALQTVGADASAFYINGAGHGFSEAEQEVAYTAVFDFLRRHRILPVASRPTQ